MFASSWCTHSKNQFVTCMQVRVKLLKGFSSLVWNNLTLWHWSFHILHRPTCIYTILTFNHKCRRISKHAEPNNYLYTTVLIYMNTVVYKEFSFRFTNEHLRSLNGQLYIPRICFSSDMTVHTDYVGLHGASLILARVCCSAVSCEE